MATQKKTLYLNRTSDAADHLLSCLGKEIRLGAPLGLGKPNPLLNLIYQRVKSDPSRQLRIYTALSLSPPRTNSDLARRFFTPFRNRHWGPDYPELDYANDSTGAGLPPNIRVHEFYFQAGSALNSPPLQQDYQSINYTHVAQSVLQAGVNVLVQIIAQDKSSGVSRYSLSCNPDLTLDIVDLYDRSNRPIIVIGVVHPDLPFLRGDAEVEADLFDVIVDDPKDYHPLFAIPRLPIDETEHAIGFYASQLLEDDGTIQIGIGALSEAVVASLLFRHRSNEAYRRMVDLSWLGQTPPRHLIETGEFHKGLYGLSELVTDGFMHMRRAGILKREVRDEKTGGRTYLHGAFFLGSKEFYEWLRNLKGDDFSGLRMGRVSKVNDLYDPNELLLRIQRKRPRFLNTCMMVTLLGGAASDTLPDGRVVSGVGGQYNFVSMSHELQDSRSILMLRSVRTSKGQRSSNVVWSHGHLTIPRHLRDIVITEYGIADIKGKTDEQTIQSLLQITDSSFQDELCEIAKRRGKLSSGYQIPTFARQNTPERVRNFVQSARAMGAFRAFPFGSDFTETEEALLPALQRLESLVETPGLMAKAKLIGALGKRVEAGRFHAELERMGLAHPKSLAERLSRRLLLSALSSTIRV